MEFDDFRKQVKDALDHLYDAAHLETHPLLTRLADAPTATRVTRAQKLRALLKDAIEQLRPQNDLPSGAPEWRSYLALRYRYVQGMNQVEIESELGISLRQLQRELHKGLDALATLLWEQPGALPAHTEHELENELNQWTLARQNCDTRELIADTLATLKPLIESRGIAVDVAMRADLPNVFVDATLARQALLNLVRLAVNQARDTVMVRAHAQDKPITFVIKVEKVLIDRAVDDWRNAELLCRAQGGNLDLNQDGDIVMFLPRATQARVLVIDDNAAIQQLFERYLAPHQYAIVHALDGETALRLAAATRPDAITLDVMMPRVDGWQILRALAENPATARIPVIVCSVLQEPELALSLGARAYLKKPVERLTLIETLTRVLESSVGTPPPPLAPN